MKIFNNSDKILIVGGTGFIGRHLAEKCLSYTPNVTCLGINNTIARHQLWEKIKVRQADICNKDQLKAVLCNGQFNYVFNLGGYIDHTLFSKGGRKLIESHYIGLMNLLECLDRKEVKGFVQIGSSDEYGNNIAPQKETMREHPISPYSLAKVAASHFLQMLYNTEEFSGTVLRLFLVYGPGQNDQRFIPQIIKGCLKNAEFKTSEGDQLRDLCYIDDVVNAMIYAAISPFSKGHIINVASGVPVRIKDVIQKIIVLTGGGRPLWGAHPYRKGENMELYADISLAKAMLQWEPTTPLDRGLQKTIDYYKNLLI
ncbi:MAG TPA: NAD-dependent epimerase/dehydratase family protein [Candidatus Brocadiaceae bacterium]